MVYMGSKNKFAKNIIPILQSIIDNRHLINFVDAMCGGCNVIDKINCQNKFAFDKNANLIDLYNKAINHEIIYPEQITRIMWDSCKDHPEENEPWLIALVEFFASSSAGGFPRGFCMNKPEIRDYYHERLRNFQKQLPQLQGVHFAAQDIFTYENKDKSFTSLIYLDPPYKGTKQYGVSKHFDSDKFWEKVRELSKSQFVIISEQSAPNDFNSIWSKEVKRNVFNAETKSARENLFVHTSLTLALGA